MNNVMTCYGENNELITIEILLKFGIEKIGKNYVAYTINDDGVSDNVNVYISEIEYENDVPRVVPIKEDEAEMVLSFYNSIKNS